MRRQKTKVLVIDHDPLFLQLLTRFLQLEGYEVDTADDGRQAMEQVEVQAPDLVLLDAALPHQPDPLTVCQRIRAHSQASIICITPSQAEEKSNLIELGADEYLCKPFDADELLAHMQRILGRVFHAGHEILLSPREYRLLACLARYAGQVVSQELLL